MQIWTIREEFKEFECKFKLFQRDSKHSKSIRSILMQILAIPKGIDAFEC